MNAGNIREYAVYTREMQSTVARIALLNQVSSVTLKPVCVFVLRRIAAAASPRVYRKIADA